MMNADLIRAATTDAAQASSSPSILPLVYDELRRIASAKLKHEGPEVTLQPTALVHEMYLRLEQGRTDQAWFDRVQFFAAAAEVMRRILIDRARRRNSLKAGGEWSQIPFDRVALSTEASSVDLLAIDEALTALEQHDRRAAELVKLRFFAGFGHGEAAKLLGIERGAADRLWILAKNWLYRYLGEN